jgi:hypothetical protein
VLKGSEAETENKRVINESEYVMCAGEISRTKDTSAYGKGLSSI